MQPDDDDTRAICWLAIAIALVSAAITAYDLLT